MPADTYTPNKNLILPGHGNYQNTWDSPVNSDFSAIDTALGGVASVSVTGLSAYQNLSISQYQPPNIIFTGALTANITFLLPAGVGGMWSISNTTIGNYQVYIQVESLGRYVTLLRGRTLVVSDGTNVDLADSSSGTFTGSLTGMTGATNGPITYRVVNGLCTLSATGSIESISATNAMTLTGLPTTCQPATGFPTALSMQVWNGGVPTMAACQYSGGGTFSFYLVYAPSVNAALHYDGGIGFQASGQKGLITGWNITYPLD